MQVPVKVLQVIDLGYEAGGAEKIARIIRDRLQQLGHEVFVLSTDMNSAGRQMFANATVPAVSGGAPARLARYFWNYEAYRKMREIVRDFDPDVVHFHTICEFSPSILWGAGRKPAILTVHGPEEFTLKLLPWVLPRSDYRHGSYRLEDLRLVGRLRYCYLRYLQRPAYLLALRRLAMVAVPSQFMARAVAGDFRRTPVRVLYPGTIEAAHSSAPQTQRPTVLFVGRLEAVKGVEYLLKAFAHVSQRHPEARLRVVGEGSQREVLETIAHDLGLSDVVEFTGWVTPAQLWREYGDATVVAIPSVAPEALALVGVEALASGRPVIGSNVGGIPELIQPGVTGAVAEPGDDRGLAEAIESFLCDPAKLEVAARVAAVRVLDFHVEKFVDSQFRLYREVAPAASWPASPIPEPSGRDRGPN
jgi:glycosyltransferase involved in cell wall biosynthesis